MRIMHYISSLVGVVDTAVVFFFKQKTAYEMRISDWSSDVCSSDLLLERRGARDVGALADVDEGGGGGGGHVFLFPFGLSLSKPCPSYPSLARRKDGPSTSSGRAVLRR